MNIKFYAQLRHKINKTSINIDIEQSISVDNLLNYLSSNINPIIKEYLIKDNKLIAGAMILINGKNILDMQNLDTLITNGDYICLFPPVGCGKILAP